MELCWPQVITYLYPHVYKCCRNPKRWLSQKVLQLHCRSCLCVLKLTYPPELQLWHVRYCYCKRGESVYWTCPTPWSPTMEPKSNNNAKLILHSGMLCALLHVSPLCLLLHDLFLLAFTQFPKCKSRFPLELSSCLGSSISAAFNTRSRRNCAFSSCKMSSVQHYWSCRFWNSWLRSVWYHWNWKTTLTKDEQFLTPAYLRACVRVKPSITDNSDKLETWSR